MKFLLAAVMGLIHADGRKDPWSFAEDKAEFSGVLGDSTEEALSSLLLGDDLVGEVRSSGDLISSFETISRFGTSFLSLDVLEFGELASGDLVRLLGSLRLPGAGDDEELLPVKRRLSGGRLAREAFFQEPSLPFVRRTKSDNPHLILYFSFSEPSVGNLRALPMSRTALYLG